MINFFNIFFIAILFIFSPITIGNEKKFKHPTLENKNLYIIRYKDLNDTVPKIEFAYNNKIEYHKGTIIIHISDFDYSLDTLVIITYKF